MASIAEIQFREASIADVPAMMKTHLAHPFTDAADSRMRAYFDCQHHPQRALLPRVGYVALANNTVVGYIAGHRTTRHDCAGEVQYLFVSREFRRRGIATQLIRLLAEWFDSQGAHKVCVALANDSPPEAKPFYTSVGAIPFKKHWYAWSNIESVLS
jgi:GNAT superfamily N-acetyltransferase